MYLAFLDDPVYKNVKHLHGNVGTVLTERFIVTRFNTINMWIIFMFN